MDVPEPVHLSGGWFAVSTDDQAAVLAAFDLSDPVPVTMRFGGSTWNNDWYSDDEHAECTRMYVTPVLDGWTLVFGTPPEQVHDDVGVRLRCAELSARFGAAHWYDQRASTGWSAWCLAEDGRVVRDYDGLRGEDPFGPPHPAESGYLLPHEEPPLPADWRDGVDVLVPGALAARYGQLQRELGIPNHCGATLIAARTSVDPTKLGAHTVHSGTGVLALTACGRWYGVPV
ncbi:MAG: hypothetical protein ABIQ18_40245 [Umezawaea sp.]